MLGCAARGHSVRGSGSTSLARIEPSPERLGSLPGPSPGQEAIHTDSFIEIRPVDPLAAPNQAPVPSLRCAPVRQSWEPNKRHSDRPAIGKIHRASSLTVDLWASASVSSVPEIFMPFQTPRIERHGSPSRRTIEMVPSEEPSATSPCTWISELLGEVCFPRVLNRFREFVHFSCRPLIVALGPAGESACPTLLDQWFAKQVGQAVSPAWWRFLWLIQNPENGVRRPFPAAGNICYHI